MAGALPPCGAAQWRPIRVMLRMYLSQGSKGHNQLFLQYFAKLSNLQN